MEEDALDQTLGLAEWQLRFALRKLVDEHGTVITFGHDGGEIVAFGVPRHLLHLFEMSQHQTHAFVPQTLVRFVPRDHGSNTRRLYTIIVSMVPSNEQIED